MLALFNGSTGTIPTPQRSHALLLALPCVSQATIGRKVGYFSCLLRIVHQTVSAQGTRHSAACVFQTHFRPNNSDPMLLSAERH